MATRLHRLGGWAFEHRWRVVAIWATVLIAVVASAAAFGGKTNDKFSVPGTESQEAQELLEQKYPAASGTYARLVFQAPEGEKLTDAENKAAVEATLAKATEAKDVSAVTNPYETKALTEDASVGFADVIYPVPADKIDDEAREELEATATPATDAGVRTEFGGGLVSDESEANSESIGIMVGFAVLAITLGSLLAAGLPLLTAIIGVGIGLVGLQALTDVIEVSETAPILATMLGLAVGIDYALFILTRYRSNLKDGMDGREAAAHATATAGSAVVFAGATVVIALVGLLVVNIPFLTVMGMAAAGTVSIAVLIALTLLPAIFGFAGHRVARMNRFVNWRPGRRRSGGDTMSIRWAKIVTRRPWVVVAVSIGMLGAIAVPATHMELGLPDAGSDPADSTERQAYDLLEEGFGPGFNGPLTVVVDAPNLPASEQSRVAGAVSEGLKEFDGVAYVSEPTQNEAGDLTVVQVTPTSGPTTQETRDLVTHLRDRADEVNAATGIDAYVTGQTAINIDTADRLNASLIKYVLVVVGLALILLTVVFRSILVPIKAAAGFLLSIAASLGAVVWIFQDGHLADVFGVSQTGPILSFLPILLIGILFGLAMDYEVFLVSRMREHFSKTGKARESVITGYGQSGRVVTAAAIIMTAVFAAFILAPDPITKSIGLSLAFGVLVDAFVIRMTVVPAVMALLGKRAWWMPKRLGRILPEVDIEGEKLAHGGAAA